MTARFAIVVSAALSVACIMAVADDKDFKLKEWHACRGRATDQADKEFASEFFVDRQGWNIDLGIPYFDTESGLSKDPIIKKYDETGRLVKTGEESDFPEIERYSARIKALTEIERREYAKSIDISYEEALVLSTNRVRLLSGRLQRRENSRLLEPLMPFDEALENAKVGNATGFYALAMHYAKGEAVPFDRGKAVLFLQKAASSDYPNAVFVTALAMEANATSPVKEKSVGRLLNERTGNNDNFVVPAEYAGVSYARFRITGLSLENDADVATIRSGYERAIALGVTAATNELERFEKRLADIVEKRLALQSEEASRKAKDEAASLLIDEELKADEADRASQGETSEAGSLRNRRLLREQQRKREAEEKTAVAQERRLDEEALREEERLEREAERAEQRAQLQQIRDEMRRAREARAANSSVVNESED